MLSEGRKLEEQNLKLLEKMHFWLPSSITMCREFISVWRHEQYFCNVLYIAQHCFWSEFSVLQEEIQISGNVRVSWWIILHREGPYMNKFCQPLCSGIILEMVQVKWMVSPGERKGVESTRQNKKRWLDPKFE